MNVFFRLVLTSIWNYVAHFFTFLFAITHESCSVEVKTVENVVEDMHDLEYIIFVTLF